MHDLRHDPDAPETQHPPSFEARMLEAAQRGVEVDDGQPRDVRTFPQMVVAELVRLVDTIQTLSLRQDVFEEELGARRDAIDARLSRLEGSLKRIADAVQVLILRLDDGK